MPACFQLFRKGTDTPVAFTEIDEELCAYMGVPVDPELYCRNWYNWLGLHLAVSGNSLDSEEMREYVSERWQDRLEGPDQDSLMQEYELDMKLLEWFAANFESSAFYQRGR